ncbi:hypothetical protein SAZ11_30075 [Streptomyces sp. FXJ1.4098]|nr:hypothetical protein [Streptomyces sp. FXJ1.4098]
MHEKDVAALRDRAERAATEALACTASNRLPDAPSDSAPPDPARVDRVRSELDALEAELAAAVPDTDPLLCTVRARLGGLYADRYQRAPRTRTGPGGCGCCARPAPPGRSAHGTRPSPPSTRRS